MDEKAQSRWTWTECAGVGGLGQEEWQEESQEGALGEEGGGFQEGEGVRLKRQGLGETE